MASDGGRENRVKVYRQRRGWSQDELARRADISRAAVSAIEVERLVPSVAAALALARTLECRVEDLFGPPPAEEAPVWAWPPAREPCRYWEALVRHRTMLFPVEHPTSGVVQHDGIAQGGRLVAVTPSRAQQTLVMACCDPAAELAAQAFARQSGFRLLVLQRSSCDALDLLRRGLVDVAGIHLGAADDSDANRKAAGELLGENYSLLRYAYWEEGLAVGAGVEAGSVNRVLRSHRRWVGRESGSGARQCQDELLGRRPAPRHVARSHRAVAEAIRGGWADVGVCVRLVCEEAGLSFLPVRDEAYDLCFPNDLQTDPRIRALMQLVRSESFRQTLGELPGYRVRAAGDLIPIH